VGKSKGKRPLGRPRSKWEDGVRMDLRKTGWGGGGGVGNVDWIRLPQNRERWRALVKTVINLWVLAPLS
jgi:hypothetical protein